MRVINVSTYNLRTGLDLGLTFAFLSDLHECDTDSVKHVLKSNPADAVLIGGDYIQNGQNYERGIGFLSYCAANYPTFCSLGNHEMKYGEGIRELTRETGAVLLDNESIEFHGVRLGGLSTGFGYGRQGNLKKTPEPDLDFLRRFSAEDGLKILLCHHPEYYPRYIKDTDIQLTLSGHAHGGQWRLFGRGVFAPGQGLFPKYTSGMYDGRLIVSRGLGDSHRFPPRINDGYEAVMINLI